ncbi:MAG: AbrB/MazE/SpoVT family DNA-binding domain-containing protein [Bacteroidota bacterium]
MQLSVIKIDNSKGIKLPKAILDQYEIEDQVELILEPDALLLKPVKRIRAGWENAFARMHEAGDDVLLIEDMLDENDWADEN